MDFTKAFMMLCYGIGVTITLISDFMSLPWAVALAGQMPFFYILTAKDPSHG